MIQEIIFFLLPIFIANIVHHFIIIRYNILPFFSQPIDNKKRFKKQRIFGKTKTYRGFLIVPTTTAILSYFLFPFLNISLVNSPFLTGLLLGLGYMLAELPNSFLKRQLSIHESSHGIGFIGLFFRIIDQIDSVAGAVFVFYILENPELNLVVSLFTIGVLLHFLFDSIVHRVGYKASSNN